MYIPYKSDGISKKKADYFHFYCQESLLKNEDISQLFLLFVVMGLSWFWW